MYRKDKQDSMGKRGTLQEVGGGAELIFSFSSGLYSQYICHNLTALGVYNTQSKTTGDSFFLSFISWVAKTQLNHSLA